MLKLKLTTIEGLPAEVAKEYKKVGDEYVLDTDVQFEDVKPLKSALDAEKKHRKEATEKVTALESENETLKARAGSVPDLEKSWATKLEKANSEAKARQEQLTGQLRHVLVDSVAQNLAQEISTVPDLLAPYLKQRLTIEEADGKMITRVLDAEGKASALSVNELKGEVVADKKFSSIITASKASGGGASGSKGGAGGKAFKDMTESEKVTLFKSNRPEYDRQSAAAKAAKPVVAAA